MATISKYYKLTLTDALKNLAPALKCALFKNTHTISASSEHYADIIANECSGTGYSAGGATLTTPASTQVSNDAKFTAAATAWTGLTLGAAARYAVIYDPTTGHIVSQHDLGGDKACTGGTLTLTWHTSGILVIS